MPIVRRKSREKRGDVPHAGECIDVEAMSSAFTLSAEVKRRKEMVL